MLRDVDGRFSGIVEEKGGDRRTETRSENPTAASICFEDSWVWDALAGLPATPAGEYFVTDLVATAVAPGRRVEALSTDDPAGSHGHQRSGAARSGQPDHAAQRINERLMLSGVTHGSTRRPPFVEPGWRSGEDTVLAAEHLSAWTTRIGRACTIGPEHRPDRFAR